MPIRLIHTEFGHHAVVAGNRGKYQTAEPVLQLQDEAGCDERVAELSDQSQLVSVRRG